MARSKVKSGKKLVIVESPTKAKTIRKFLGKDYIVDSCMGHVRDLPQSAKDIPAKYKKFKWATLGVNVDEEFEPIYCIPKNKTKIVSQLKAKLEDADELYLATDEDREGESISWHLFEVLKPEVPVKRMVFHEITKKAIEAALKDTRAIDENLVRAQEARRILDRLVGYTISPLLWKKVAYGLSAGRVQSVAVKIICERELERMRFIQAAYWGLTGNLSVNDTKFESRIFSYSGKRIALGKDFDPHTGKLNAKGDVLWLDEATAKSLESEISKLAWSVIEIEEKPVSRKPAAPFITSSLQQEANRKFSWGARETMRAAQQLYEQGFITYMRTDSTFLSTQAIDAARSAIKELYGKDYLPQAPREYSGKKVKGAQEAHEAIRPAGTEFQRPDDTGLKADLYKLYDLIWKRTMASQMADAQQKQVSARIQSGKAIFSASGTTIVFPGFLRAYVEGSDDPEAALEDRDVILPKMKVGDKIKLESAEITSHETKPVARYTEASLIQTMEKEGIGRPSTYAPTISTIIDRGYVAKTGNALAPTFTAMVVNKLMSQHFPEYVDLGFTSGMEKSLDLIADGDLEMVAYLKELYLGKKGLRAQVEKEDKLIDPEEARGISFEALKGISVRVGRYGAYASRSEKDGTEVSASLPEGLAPAEVTMEIVNKLIDQKINGADALGKHPVSGLPIYVLTGRYGAYVQLGDVSKENDKPKRSSLPATLKPEEVTLDKAVALLALPRLLGTHPGTTKDIKAGLGRFGPYIVHDGDFRSIPKDQNLFEISLEKALEMLAQPKKGRGRAAPIKDLGKHPNNELMVLVMNGRYGPYINWGKVNVSLPEDVKPEDVTIAQALELLSSKATDEDAEEPKAKLKSKTKAVAVAKVQLKVPAQTAAGSKAIAVSGKSGGKTNKAGSKAKAVAVVVPLKKPAVKTKKAQSL